MTFANNTLFVTEFFSFIYKNICTIFINKSNEINRNNYFILLEISQIDLIQSTSFFFQFK